ncbi:protein shisa-5 [Elgaria multicarinata webbii]|uniref:protein shisa-5 n=1 Tax=Elgaria multicarinata webbii TaxID=159646 RepID=UPI002FCD13B2
MAFTRSSLLSLAAFLWLFLLLRGGFCEDCKIFKDSDEYLYLGKPCPKVCCGSCSSQYCCSNSLISVNENYEHICILQAVESTYPSTLGEPMKFKSDFDDWPSPGPSGSIIAIGVSIFILFIVTIIVCFTCSCCCLYKACRREPRPIVTTTTATTVVQVPYPQQPGVPVSYPAGAYQGYHPVPVQPQPGMPAAPYPTQYPPPYPAPPAAPPAYHETMAAGAGAPAIQPPYNPAYMDPPKPSY